MEQSQKAVVLVLRSEAEHHRLFEELEARHCRVVVCHEIEAAMACLAHMQVELLVSELQLHPLAGLDGLKLLHYAAIHYPEVKAICLSPLHTEEIANAVSKHPQNMLHVGVLSASDLDAFLAPIQVPQNKASFLRLPHLERNRLEYQTSRMYQPIFCIKNNVKKILGFEVLSRIVVEGKKVAPELFFAYASKKHQLFEVESHCIENSLNEAVFLQNKVDIFLNIRPRTLLHSEFVPHLEKCRKQYGYRPQNLVLELTEQEPILNFSLFQSTIRDLAALGYKVALDDFGVGCANLQLLYLLRPAFVKLSGFFSRELENDSCKQKLVETLFEMVNSLQGQCVLENIESEETLLCGQKLGLSFAQGFHLGEPAVQKEIQEKYLSKGDFSVSSPSKAGI